MEGYKVSVLKTVAPLVKTRHYCLLLARHCTHHHTQHLLPVSVYHREISPEITEYTPENIQHVNCQFNILYSMLIQPDVTV